MLSIELPLCTETAHNNKELALGVKDEVDRLAVPEPLLSVPLDIGVPNGIISSTQSLLRKI